MPTALGSLWTEIGRDLGIEVVAPFQLVLPGGSRLEVDALVKNFGASNGTVVVDDYSKIEAVAPTLLRMGYGFSTLSVPSPTESYNRELYEQILSEWEWCGSPNEKPGWVREPQGVDGESDR